MNELGLEKISYEPIYIPYSIIENYLFEIKGLSANKKLYFLTIRKYAGAEQKPAFPSYSTLMDDIGSNSTATIMKCNDFFIWLHWLEKLNRTDPSTKEKISNYYFINLKNIEKVLEHFKVKNYSFKEIEAYFEKEYKSPTTRKILLSTPCKYLF